MDLCNAFKFWIERGSRIVIFSTNIGVDYLFSKPSLTLRYPRLFIKLRTNSDSAVELSTSLHKSEDVSDNALETFS